ncbi:L-idonate 5-dehydrogenase [Trifolium pratense]|uniref:L-idonate 5-dehydrogenase n=1 Tax=Trifolium pratense TaxID=57577 RepID=A0A2K3M0Q1_TRIPR|nr:L-idonate 5-dehydrogenase [Trifolium pratense]
MFEGPHDVRIRMKAVGICGSDVHYLKKKLVVRYRVVPGARVAMEPGISCWHCDHCKLGRYNLFPEMKFFATPPVHGSFANQKNATDVGAIAVVILLRTLQNPLYCNRNCGF